MRATKSAPARRLHIDSATMIADLPPRSESNPRQGGISVLPERTIKKIEEPAINAARCGRQVLHLLSPPHQPRQQHHQGQLLREQRWLSHCPRISTKVCSTRYSFTMTMGCWAMVELATPVEHRSSRLSMEVRAAGTNTALTPAMAIIVLLSYSISLLLLLPYSLDRLLLVHLQANSRHHHHR